MSSTENDTDLKAFATKRVLENEEWKDEIRKAHYAFHANVKEDGAHHFHHEGRRACCQFCGRTREEVRYDDKPPTCKERPDWVPLTKEKLEEIIRSEENEYLDLLAEAEERLPEMVDDPRSLTGEEIAVLQHTHGFQPSVVEGALDFEMSEEQRKEYEDAMEEHRQKSQS